MCDGTECCNAESFKNFPLRLVEKVFTFERFAVFVRRLLGRLCVCVWQIIRTELEAESFDVQGSVHRKYIRFDIFPTRCDFTQFIYFCVYVWVL